MEENLFEPLLTRDDAKELCKEYTNSGDEEFEKAGHARR
jgi:hypothetical protein